MKRTSGGSRREFIKAAAGGVAVPWIVPASVLGAPGRPGPSGRIGVGIIGTGKMANDYHIPELLRAADTQVLAVCDVDTNRRNHAKKRVDDHYAQKGGPKDCAAYNDFRQLVDRRDVDAVCIATPEHWHALPAIAACKAGKDVYCEKPLTLTILESKRLIEVVRKHKRVFQTGSQQRSNVFGPFCEAVDVVRSGRLGKIRTVRVGVGGPSRWCDLLGEPVEPGLDWNLWLGCAPVRPYHAALSPRGVHNHFPAWRSYREYSGGGHADMGAHHYDIAQWALGMDESGPVEIIPPDDPKAQSGVKYVYAGGIEMFHGGPSGCTFEGTNGKLYIERGVLRSEPEGLAKEPLGKNDARVFRSPGHHRNWLDAIKSRGRPVADVEAGARTVTIVLLGNLAYWHHRRLRWDPQKWQFVGDAEANTWLDCPRRNPWQLPEA